jgi:hypothetical protein
MPDSVTPGPKDAYGLAVLTLTAVIAEWAVVAGAKASICRSVARWRNSWPLSSASRKRARSSTVVTSASPPAAPATEGSTPV